MLCLLLLLVLSLVGSVFRVSVLIVIVFFFFFSSRRRHTRSLCDWSSDVCSSDLIAGEGAVGHRRIAVGVVHPATLVGSIAREGAVGDRKSVV